MAPLVARLEILCESSNDGVEPVVGFAVQRSAPKPCCPSSTNKSFQPEASISIVKPAYSLTATPHHEMEPRQGHVQTPRASTSF